MSAAVRRLSSLTPEGVLRRRGSCDPLSIAPNFLDSKSVTPARRRASVGPSEASFIHPSYFSEKQCEKRNSLFVPEQENGPQSAAYLHRKRASLDNIWNSPQQLRLKKSPSESEAKFDQQSLQSGSGELSRTIRQNKSPLFSPNSPVFVEQLMKSPGLRCSSNGILDFTLLSPTHIALTSQSSCEIIKSDTIRAFPSFDKSITSDNWQEDNLSKIGKLNLNCTTPIQQQSRHGSLTYSSKVKIGQRKRSSPSLVIPALSPCIENKIKASHFDFNALGLKDAHAIESKAIEKVVPGAKRVSVPRIHIDTVDVTDDCHRYARDNSFENLSPALFDKKCENLSHITSCLHCKRRRHSMGDQLCHVCKQINYKNRMNGPSTPQPWQLQHNLLHIHHQILHLRESGHGFSFVGYSLIVQKCKAAFEDLTHQPIGNIIGRGGFGVVKLGCFKGKSVAVKVLKGKRAALSARKEANALMLRPHVHVNTMYAVVTSTRGEGLACVLWPSDTDTPKKELLPKKTIASLFGLSVEEVSPHTSRDPNQADGTIGWACVVSELCTSYSLLTLINDCSIVITPREKVRFIGEIASGLCYLHTQGVIHLDVKPANALLSKNGHIRLADFGCSSESFDPDQHVLGTISYQAPEVLLGKGCSDRSDIFSLGITTWHLLTLTQPFQGLHPHVVLYQVTRLCYRPTDHQAMKPGAFTLLEQLLKGIAERCWVKNPSDRPSASSLSSSLAALYLSPAS